MELQSISQVSRDYGISVRMIRYYEQVGLIESKRKEDYAYRVYDESNLIKLRQIITLRKLRVPVKQIVSILNNTDAAEVVEIFRKNISQLDEEITALSTVKGILTRFVEEINEKTDVKLKLLGDEDMLSAISTLSFSNNQIKENKEDVSMDVLNKADESLNKLEDKDVRIVYLPPMTVAAAYASGDGAEGKAANMIKQFVDESGLLSIKPDARSFGFDCSSGATGTGELSQVYEMWVSVPDDMEIPKPLVRRTFNGGLYAAHVLRSWDFDDWRLLKEWVVASDKYDNDWNSPRWTSLETVAGQGFEETLNYYNYVQKGCEMQLDLLFPIREKDEINEQENSSNTCEIVNKKDLSDVCDYMKAIIIPEIPNDFVISDDFGHGLSVTELEAGITAFRTFLYRLFDKLASDKDKIDVETAKNFNPDLVDGLVHVCSEGSIHKCFPVINDLAVIMFSMGYHGKLETKSDYKLIVAGSDLNKPFDSKNEKINSFINIPSERKKELFGILSGLGFKFEGIDFSKEIDFSKVETLNVRHEDNSYLVVGLKLLAEAQTKKKTTYYNLKEVFMRCDFYPLSQKNVKVKDLNFNLFLSPHSQEIREWIIDIDKYLTDNGCSVASEINNFNSNIILIYTSRKTGDKICKISLGIEGCKAFPYGRHFASEDNILSYLPESMFTPLTDGKNLCTGCASKRPDLVPHNIRYTIEGKSYARCHGKGFGYSLDNADEREVIGRWIEMEIEWYRQ